MAAKDEVQTLSDECFDVKCTLCTKKNRIKQAQQYCKDCRKNLCYDCEEIHNDYIEGHTLVDELGDDEEVNLLTEKCVKHKDKLIELFCVDHDEVVCGICALLEHRKCEELKHITDSIEDLNKDQKVHEVPKQLKTTLQDVDQVLSALEKHVEELSLREHTFLEEIEEYTKKLLAKIETLRRNARKVITTKHEQDSSEAIEKRTVCATAKANLMKCMNDMASAGNRKAHLFILKKRGQCMTNNVERLCRESEKLMKRVKFIFRPDLRLGDTLNDLVSLATEGEKYKASLKLDIDASVKGDSDSCVIEGCCLLSDGTVILSDYKNKRVKHVDTSHCTIKDHCDLHAVPIGITCIGPHEVAICTRSLSVQVVSLGSKLATTSTIQLNHFSYRLAHSNGELFAGNGNCMNVYDLTGRLLRTICKNNSGENMFSIINCIVLNQSGDRVYVADRENGLVCTDRAGQEVFRRPLKELGLSIAHGVCTDQRGNVLVSGCGSHNVVQVTEDGRVIGEILSKADGIKNPQCLCYDADKHTLYVGGQTSKLLVYQLT